MRVGLPALLARGEIDLSLEEVLAEVAPRFLQYAVKRCAKAHGKEIVMEKHYCDHCGKEMASNGSTIEGTAEVGDKTLQLQTFLFSKGEDDSEYDTELDVCPGCYAKIISQLVDQAASK